MEKKCGKKYLLSLRDSLHIKRALSSIRLKRKTRRERERVRTQYAVVVVVVVCFSAWNSVVVVQNKRLWEDGSRTCHRRRITSAATSRRYVFCVLSDVMMCFSMISRRQKKRIGKWLCGWALLFVFLSSHTHLVLCVVNNKCLLSLDDDDNRSRWRNRWNRGNART